MLGLDVSKWDYYNTIKGTFKADTEACYRQSEFVIVKLTQGSSSAYGNYAVVCKRVINDNKLLGVYHYAAGGNAESEAAHFHSHYKKYAGVAVPWLDWESLQNSAWGDSEWPVRFVRRFRELSGVLPGVYVQASAIWQVGALEAMGCPLWVAGYPTDRASWSVPNFHYDISPWKAYDIWQFTSGGDTVDRNVSNLTRADWERLARKSTARKETTVKVTVGSARIDENGNASGGRAGDQSGRELATEPYYRHPKGWRVFRARTANQRKYIAAAMRAACRSEYIGYDQSQRNTLYNAAKKVKFRISKVKTKCETDCSALVRVCCARAGITLPDFNTESEPSVLMNSGQFTEVTGKVNQGTGARLKVGDILVTRTKGHTVVVTAVSDEGVAKTLADVARDVIAGKYGNYPERKKLLEADGYDYEEVRALVNRMCND